MLQIARILSEKVRDHTMRQELGVVSDILGLYNSFRPVGGASAKKELIVGLQ
jgi:hypothetical protein